MGGIGGGIITCCMNLIAARVGEMTGVPGMGFAGIISYMLTGERYGILDMICGGG